MRSTASPTVCDRLCCLDGAEGAGKTVGGYENAHKDMLSGDQVRVMVEADNQTRAAVVDPPIDVQCATSRI